MLIEDYAEKVPSIAVNKIETLRERLERKRKNLEIQLSDVTMAIDALDSNPALEKFHNAISRVGY